MTGASAGNVNRVFAGAGSSPSRSVARAGIWRMRGCCTGPVENPSFHVRSPSSNASNNVDATGVVTAVDSSVRVRVIIVTLLLESGVSRKRNKLTGVLQRLHSFFRRGYLTRGVGQRRVKPRHRRGDHEPRSAGARTATGAGRTRSPVLLVGRWGSPHRSAGQGQSLGV